jgi:hypothetical protein
MSILSVLHKDQPGAASRTAATADDARALGFTNVQTRYEPQTGHHTVTGTPPPAPNDPSSITR